MSSIYKLSIQGVRSFNSEHSETIQFGFPLTLICGQNGCGKTTIIESLKYATTGYLPPNSKGGAFINDPNISNRNIVNAQIKLAFKSINNDSMIITRSMQLIKKGKDKFTFKTLENQLSKINRGEKTTISGKNSDLDNELPTYLGISKSILDYVIFCHQDESLWPLSEPSVLKKKFDDIFQASKFTKVLDNLKSINKDLTVDIKLLEKSVEHLKIDKKRSNKIMNNLNDLKTKLDGLNEDIHNLAFEINDKEEKLNRLFNANQDFHAILSKFDALNFSKQTLSQQFERLSNSIEILPDELDTLLAKFSNFDLDLAENDKNIEAFSEANTKLQLSIEELQEDLSKLHRLEGSLASKRDAYTANVEKLQLAVGGDKDDFIAELNKNRDRLEVQLQSLRTSNHKVKAEKERQLNDKIQQIMLEESQEKARNEMIDDYKMKIQDLNRKINAMNISEDKLDFERGQLAKLKEKQTSSNSNELLKEVSRSIDENNTRVEVMEKEIEEINKQITKMNAQNDLIVKKNYLIEANELKNSSINSNLKKLSKFLGTEINRTNFESSFNVHYSQLEQSFMEVSKIEQKSLTRANAAETMLTSANTNLANMNKRRDELLSKIQDKIAIAEVSSYEQILSDLEEDYQITLESLNTFDITKQFKIKAIEIAKESHCCTLCRRDLKGNEYSNFVTVLKNDIDNMDVTKLKKDSEEAKADFESMKSINPYILELQKLETEIQAVTKKLASLETEKGEAADELKTDRENLTETKEKYSDAGELKHVINQLKKDMLDIQDNDRKIESLSSEMSDTGIHDFTIEELSKMQIEKGLEIKNLRARISNDLETKFAKQREISKLEGNIKDQELKISNIEKSLNDLLNFQATIKVYEKDKVGLEEANSKSVEALILSKQEKEMIEKENASLFSKLRAQEDDLENTLNEVVSQLNSIEALVELIHQFEEHDMAQLESNLQAIQTTKDKINSRNAELAENETNLKQCERKKSEIANLKAIVRDNIDYQNSKKELEKLEQEITALNIQDAEKQRERFQEESKSLRELVGDLNSENANKLGQMKQIQDQIQSLQEELSTEYKDVDQHYHEEWVKLQTNLLVSNDIVNYSKSLDNAIMKFHSMKMTEINKIVKDLWIRTYRGTDIDYIAIKSDMNTQSKGNRSYNYRVVMYKTGVELDMRGRCSAGQKVLTSILIRLALAECFGSNCGIIALDEPTTNLDAENTESLAESLNKIIEFRKDQKNFQLIVITHDEKFLSHINGGQFIDNFYKVQRDENQFSTIKSLPIQYIQEE